MSKAITYTKANSATCPDCGWRMCKGKRTYGTNVLPVWACTNPNCSRVCFRDGKIGHTEPPAENEPAGGAA